MNGDRILSGTGKWQRYKAVRLRIVEGDKSSVGTGMAPAKPRWFARKNDLGSIFARSNRILARRPEFMIPAVPLLRLGEWHPQTVPAIFSNSFSAVDGFCRRGFARLPFRAHLGVTQFSSAFDEMEGGNPSLPDPQAQAEQAKTLWVGNVTPGMDEAMLVQLFSSAGEPPVETKVMRDKYTNQASGYGFATFSTAEQAQRVLTNLNGQTAPGTQYTYAFELFFLNYLCLVVLIPVVIFLFLTSRFRRFRLNYSSFKPSNDRQRGGPGGRGPRGGPGGMMMGGGMGGGMPYGMGGYPSMGYPMGNGMAGNGGGSGGNRGSENTLFVGDLDVSVNEDVLRNAISSAFPSVAIAHVRIVSDQATGQPKGYGFVRFNSEADMQTVYAGSGQQLVIAGKAARIKPAMHRPKPGGPMHSGFSGAQPMYHPAPYGQPPMHGMMPGYGQPPMGYAAYPGYPPAAYAPYPNYYAQAPPPAAPPGRAAPYKPQ